VDDLHHRPLRSYVDFSYYFWLCNIRCLENDNPVSSPVSLLTHLVQTNDMHMLSLKISGLASEVRFLHSDSELLFVLRLQVGCHCNELSLRLRYSH